MGKAMNRKSFLCGLVALAVAPKSIAIDLVRPGIVSPAVEHLVCGKYIAGYMKMSKQLMANLPFLQETLPKILLRDFEKNINDETIPEMV